MSDNIASIDDLALTPDPAEAQSVLDRANKLREAAAERGQVLRETVKTQASEIKATASTKVGEFKEITTKQSSQLKGQATEQLSVTKEKLEITKDEVVEYIEANPKQAAAIAFGAGLVLGLIFRR